MDTKEQIEQDRKIGKALAAGPCRLFLTTDHPTITNEHRYSNFRMNLTEFEKKHPLYDAIRISKGLEARASWLKRFKKHTGISTFKIRGRKIIPNLKLVAK